MARWGVCSYPLTQECFLKFPYLPILSSLFPKSKGFPLLYPYKVLSSMLFLHFQSHTNLVTLCSKKLSQPPACQTTSCSLLFLLFLQGLWIKMEFYHREATRSCSCMIHPGTESVDEAPQRHWGESSSSTSSPEKIPGSVVQTKSDKVVLQHVTSGKTCIFNKNCTLKYSRTQSFCSKRGYRLILVRLMIICSTELLPWKLHTHKLLSCGALLSQNLLWNNAEEAT